MRLPVLPSLTLGPNTFKLGMLAQISLTWSGQQTRTQADGTGSASADSSTRAARRTPAKPSVPPSRSLGHAHRDEMYLAFSSGSVNSWVPLPVRT